jgi:hypothetical protein
MAGVAGTSHRDSVEHRIPGQRIGEHIVGEDVGVDAGVRTRDAEPRARAIVSLAMRDRHHARHDRIRHLDGHLDAASL